MRTTLTLDDDVAAKLQSLARRTGQAFKDVVNETLRRGLSTSPESRRREPFRIRTRDLGAVRPGITLDSIADAIEHIEGPLHR